MEKKAGMKIRDEVRQTHLIENFDRPSLSYTGKQKENFFLHRKTCYGSLPTTAREACCAGAFVRSRLICETSFYKLQAQ